MTHLRTARHMLLRITQFTTAALDMMRRDGGVMTATLPSRDEMIAEAKALAESEGRIAIADARYNNAEKVRKAGDINEKKLRQMFDYRGEYKYGTAKTKNDPNLKPTSA